MSAGCEMLVRCTRICGIWQDSAWIFTYSSAANRRDDFQDLCGLIIYTHKKMEQYATVCKNVNVGRRKEGKRFSSKCRRYRFFCPLGRYIIEDLLTAHLKCMSAGCEMLVRGTYVGSNLCLVMTLTYGT